VPRRHGLPPTALGRGPPGRNSSTSSESHEQEDPALPRPLDDQPLGTKARKPFRPWGRQWAATDDNVMRPAKLWVGGLSSGGEGRRRGPHHRLSPEAKILRPTRRSGGAVRQPRSGRPENQNGKSSAPTGATRKGCFRARVGVKGVPRHPGKPMKRWPHPVAPEDLASGGPPAPLSAPARGGVGVTRRL